MNHRSDASNPKNDELLTNPSATELSVALYAHLATAEQVGDRRNRFLSVFGAGANCKNEIPEREFGSRFQNLGVPFHNGLSKLEQIRCHAFLLDRSLGRLFNGRRKSADTRQFF